MSGQFPRRETGGDEEASLHSAANEPDSKPVRVGTVYQDPVTGEWVMPADFVGDEELRWPADKPPIGCKTGATLTNDEPSSRLVPLDDQRAALRAGGEKALLKLRDDLSRRSYREHILGMAEDRLVTVGFPQYRDKACHLSRDEAQHEADCEISDYPVYICLGGMADDPR